jgi:hypothetical protein
MHPFPVAIELIVQAERLGFLSTSGSLLADCGGVLFGYSSDPVWM